MIHVATATCAKIKKRLSNVNVQWIYTHWNYIPGASGISGSLTGATSLGSVSWFPVNPQIAFMKKEES